MWKVESDGFGWEQQIMTWQLGGSRATFTFTCTCTAIELELASGQRLRLNFARAQVV